MTDQELLTSLFSRNGIREKLTEVVIYPKEDSQVLSIKVATEIYLDQDLIKEGKICFEFDSKGSLTAIYTLNERFSLSEPDSGALAASRQRISVLAEIRPNSSTAKSYKTKLGRHRY